MSVLCPQCGAPAKEGAMNCEYCGAALHTPVQPPVYQAPQQTYSAPQQPYGAPQQPYGAPQQPYGAPQQPYGMPQQPYGASAPRGRAPISKRPLGTCLLLTLITCGIYGIYWMICMVDDLNAASYSNGAPSGGTVFLLSLVTCGIYTLIWMYKAGEQLGRAKEYATGAPGGNNGILFLLLCLVGLGIIPYFMIQNDLNQIAAN